MKSRKLIGVYIGLLIIAVATMIMLWRLKAMSKAEVLPRDYPEIKEEGVLRLVTEYNQSGYYVAGDTIEGFQYELSQAIAQLSGLEVQTLLEMSLAESFDMLEDNKCDIVARNIPITSEIKEKYLCDGIAEYAKRLSRYCRLTFCQVADEKTPDKASEALNTQIKNTEGERLMKHIREQDYVIALAIDGKTPDSVELSQKIEKLGVSGISSIAFVIGGSLGLSESVLKRADYKLSFSRMTFPHQLMQMILLEQVYRSYRIMNHEPYHK